MSERAKRRLAAIVAADVAGYSRLIGMDEEGTLQALKSHRRELVDPLIAQFGGRVANTAGDSLLLEFPSAVDAVKCALAMQQGMAARNVGSSPDRRICFRVGINVGDVVSDGEDLLGDGVNVAARVESLAEAGGIAISDDAYRQVRDRMDVAWQDGGEREVKNIARPIRVWRWQAAAPVPSAAMENATVPASNKPAIAVLPFANMSGERDQEYFADGIAEDIITGLSRFRDFLVIARNTTFTFKGKAVDVAQLSRDLNARYVVEGSVRKAGDRVRVTAQLIDGDSGAHIWGDRYDGVLEDVFDLQDAITAAIVTNVAPQSLHAEVRRATHRQETDLGTWDLLMRARWHMGRYNRADSAEALRLFRAVIARDRRNAQAYGWLALMGALAASYGWSEDPPAALDAAVAASRQAVALDPLDALGHAVGWLAPARDLRHAEAVASCRRAIDLNPNMAMAHGMLALVLGLSGRYDEAVEALKAARRLSPLDPELPLYLTGVGMGAFAVGRYDEVLKLGEEVIDINPELPAPYRQRAAAFALLDRSDEAKRALARLLELTPGLTVAKVQTFLPLPPEVLQRHIEALRKAGLPE